jgi:hypothetical protein
MGGAFDQVAAQQVVDLVLEHPDLPHLLEEIESVFLGEAVGPQDHLVTHGKGLLVTSDFI